MVNFRLWINTKRQCRPPRRHRYTIRWLSPELNRYVFWGYIVLPINISFGHVWFRIVFGGERASDLRWRRSNGQIAARTLSRIYSPQSCPIQAISRTRFVAKNIYLLNQMKCKICLLLSKAYKTVLHSYGLDSNPSSDENDEVSSDLEMMEVSLEFVCLELLWVQFCIDLDKNQSRNVRI